MDSRTWTRSSSSAMPNGDSTESSPAPTIPVGDEPSMGPTVANRLPPSSSQARSRVASSVEKAACSPAITTTLHPRRRSCASGDDVSTLRSS